MLCHCFERSKRLLNAEVRENYNSYFKQCAVCRNYEHSTMVPFRNIKLLKFGHDAVGKGL